MVLPPVLGPRESAKDLQRLHALLAQSTVVENLGAVWVEAEKLAGRPLDPLDPDLVAALS